MAAAPSRRTATVNWVALGNGLLPTLLSVALVAFMIFAFNLKLTALIAALNKTEQVDAALAGEITDGTSNASDQQ